MKDATFTENVCAFVWMTSRLVVDPGGTYPLPRGVASKRAPMVSPVPALRSNSVGMTPARGAW